MVTDANGCTAATTVTVGSTAGINLDLAGTNVNCFGDTNGSINLEAAGGSGTFTYEWDNGLGNVEIQTIYQLVRIRSQ